MTQEESEQYEKEWRANVTQELRDHAQQLRDHSTNQTQTAVALEHVMGLVSALEARMANNEQAVIDTRQRDEKRPALQREWLMILILAASVLVPAFEYWASHR